MSRIGDSLEVRTRELRRRDFGGWSSEQLVRLLAANGVGLLMIAASSYEAARATTMRDALGWLNLGLLGLAIAAASDAMWLLHGRESVSFARALLLPGADAVTGMVGFDRHPKHGVERSGGVPIYAAAAGLARYHRPDCPFIAGRAVDLARRDAHERNGLLPCEACEP